MQAAAPAVLALALAVAACGGGGSSTTTRVEQAAAKTAAAKTAGFSVSATATAAGRTISQIGQGQVDFGRHAVDVKFARPAQATAGGGDQRTIIVGTDSWTTTPASVLDKLPSAKPFLHSTTAERNANPLSQLTQPDDPTRVLGELTGVDAATIKRVGKEDIRGTPTTHITGQVDLTKVAASDDAAKPQAEALGKLMGTNVMPIELWVDSDGRARRVQVTLQHLRIAPALSTTGTTATTAEGAGLQIDLTIVNDFYDFGSAVKIDPPPADQVTELSQIPA
jgi:hypothetical protein